MGAHEGLLVGVDCTDAVFGSVEWVARVLWRRGFRLRERLLSAVMGRAGEAMQNNVT